MAPGYEEFGVITVMRLRGAFMVFARANGTSGERYDGDWFQKSAHDGGRVGDHSTNDKGTFFKHNEGARIRHAVPPRTRVHQQHFGSARRQ